MCGIAGILSADPNLISKDKIKKMTDVIAHRGPDGEGQWVAENGKVGLGHRRLSIIDLSHEADQPMHYLDRYTIVFNGEIYNYIELKNTLVQQGYKFKTQSDTEVLMALYDRDKENCLQLLDGMFSFVLYDSKENIAFCARDRFGEKPFFYSYEKGKHFYFGSEMKCLWASDIKREMDPVMMFNYLSFGYLDNPAALEQTFYNKIEKLLHSHYMTINLNNLEISIKKYYDINWRNIDKSITEAQAKEKLKELFYTSIKRRLRSDVPVGSSLSGGLDSSLVVCVIDELAKENNQKQKTFSAVFPGFKKDERKYMDYVIAKTNVDPHFTTPNEEGLLKELEKLCWHQEEPFVSGSIYAQYSVMKLAKENDVTVLLDGQGADEVLAGYHPYYTPYFNELKKYDRDRYNIEINEYKKLHSLNNINGITRKPKGDYIRALSKDLVKPVKRAKLYYENYKNPVFDTKFLSKYSGKIFETPGNHFYSLNEALYTSTMVNSLQHLLRYADRNSMAHSREVRLPFLYHELVDFLFTLPTHFKIKSGWTKWIMRETFDILPDEIRWRVDKIGYEPPQKKWLESDSIKQKIREFEHWAVERNILNAKLLNKQVETDEVFIMKHRSWQKLMLSYYVQ